MGADMDTHGDYTRIEKALSFIWDHYTDQPDLAVVADHVNLSPFHFQRLFQEWAGVSPKKFLQFVTLEAARARLRENVDILGAAHDLGMSSPSRLHDLFISVEGVTPGEYKAMGAGVAIYYGFFPSPFGDCLLAATERGLCALSFEGREQALAALRTDWPKAVLQEKSVYLESYHQAAFGQYTGKPLKLWLKGTPFRLKVWEALLRIPEGELVSYTQLAEMVGRPDATRAVANAVANNRIAKLIPCHRVIRKLGQMGGYRWGVPRKLSLIGWEATRQGSMAKAW